MQILDSVWYGEWAVASWTPALFKSQLYLEQLRTILPNQEMLEGQSRVSLQPHLCFNHQAQGIVSHADHGCEHQLVLLKDLGTSQVIPSGPIPHEGVAVRNPGPPFMRESAWSTESPAYHVSQHVMYDVQYSLNIYHALSCHRHWYLFFPPLGILRLSLLPC